MTLGEAIIKAGWNVYRNGSGAIDITQKGTSYRIRILSGELSVSAIELRRDELQDILKNNKCMSVPNASIIGAEYGLCCKLLKDLAPYICSRFTFWDYCGTHGLSFGCSSETLDILEEYGKHYGEDSGYNRLADVLGSEMEKIVLETIEQREEQ